MAWPRFLQVRKKYRKALRYWTTNRMKGAIPVEDIYLKKFRTGGKKVLSWIPFLVINLMSCCNVFMTVYELVTVCCLDEIPWWRLIHILLYIVSLVIVLAYKVMAESNYPAFSGTGQPPTERAPKVRVDDQDIIKSPYASIGRIYAAPKNKFNKDVYATAFYIGQPTKINGFEVHRLLTVAHAMENTKYHVFVPSSNQNLTNGDEIYLIYPEKEGILPHPKYRCESGEKTYHYDLCVAYVVPYQYKSSQAMKPENIGEKLPPLQLVVYKDLNTSNVIEVIGFPDPRWCPSFGQLTKIKGNFICSHTIRYYHYLTIQIDNFVPIGMSGGPWILDNKVCGIQCSVVKQPNGQKNAVSPTFREELLKELGLEYEILN